VGHIEYWIAEELPGPIARKIGLYKTQMRGVTWILVVFSFWVGTFTPSEKVALGSAFLVLIGVIGEYVAEVDVVEKRWRLKTKIKRFSMAILVLGLSGDVLGIVMGQAEMAALTKEAADAATFAHNAAIDAQNAHGLATGASVTADAAKGEADAAALEANAVSRKAGYISAELIFAQRVLGARHVLDESAISSDLEKGFKGKRISFKSYFQDWEALNLCNQLVDAASKPTVGVIVENECGTEPLPAPPHFPIEELKVTAPSIEEAQRLSMAIAKQGVVILFVNLGVTPEPTVMVGHLPSEPLFWPKQPKGSIKTPNKTRAKQ